MYGGGWPGGMPLVELEGLSPRERLSLKTRISIKSFEAIQMVRLRIALQHVQSTLFSVVMPFQPSQRSLFLAMQTSLVQCLSSSCLSDLGKDSVTVVCQVLC